jgi:hypothetical protein
LLLTEGAGDVAVGVAGELEAGDDRGVGLAVLQAAQAAGGVVGVEDSST